MSSPSTINISNDASSSLIATGSKSVLFFWADWHPSSRPGGSFDAVFHALAKDATDVKFYRVEAEEALEVSKKYNVTAVPTFLFIDTDGSILDRIDGGEDVAKVTQCYARLINSTSSHETSPPENHAAATVDPEQAKKAALHTRLQSLITSSPIMLFLKGSPTAPKCGFSRQAVEILTSHNLPFGYFDILQDDTVRQGLKEYSDWPTYPQLYVRGELMGGLDIMKEMVESGDFVEQLDVAPLVKSASVGGGGSRSAGQMEEDGEATSTAETTLHEKLQQLINRHRIMLFMKGIPSSPRCGFSRQIVEILDSYNVSYDSFNILEDEEVRQGLKEYSDWPTYPQLYVEGDLVGGLDIVKEMLESGDLKDLLTGDMKD
eukprot:CCRYP_003671-RA/>CCRYP_003671-RA protein AED:0.39 eAED:0.39 QI:91/1/1/1/1/1/2/131/374